MTHFSKNALLVIGICISRRRKSALLKLSALQNLSRNLGAGREIFVLVSRDLLCVCVSVTVHVQVYVWMWGYVCTCVQVRMCTYVSVNMLEHVYVHMWCVYVHVYQSACSHGMLMCKCVFLFMHYNVCVFVCMHACVSQSLYLFSETRSLTVSFVFMIWDLHGQSVPEVLLSPSPQHWDCSDVITHLIFFWDC